ncbi:RHS repeat-associated core domain-containing protein [Streptomyces sp. NBC_00513]|uniref:RHS repeat-associated core domain-containing protein n=1 Tax=unclassified Streptomyces TaxID=2593676 RepID=UPI002255A67A|nr:RHS repeat-associated core domain-containing protein [Streptomyces sp. NBC_00424]MCX5071192.1 RHS repeat-associated core domain-containing protein [Streptomyces sp. NBC_00424]WUD45392.1 RHS repeat-associated core domain-containing protein [Streptomyces sp. NBC_00513]
MVSTLAADGTSVSSSRVYDAFGNVTASASTNPSLGYQSGWTDNSTGEVNMTVRWYQPGTGSFTSRDTWQLDPNPSAQANRYTYANASPLNGTDPTGHRVEMGGGSGSAGVYMGWFSQSSGPHVGGVIRAALGQFSYQGVLWIYDSSTGSQDRAAMSRGYDDSQEKRQRFRYHGGGGGGGGAATDPGPGQGPTPGPTRTLRDPSRSPSRPSTNTHDGQKPIPAPDLPPILPILVGGAATVLSEATAAD